MKKDRRTKAELLVSLDKAISLEQRTMDAKHEVERLLRRAKFDKDAAEVVLGKQAQVFESIRQTIKTAVALKYPKTVAFGSIEEVRFDGRWIHPDYDGDGDEVRLLKLIDDACQDGLTRETDE